MSDGASSATPRVASASALSLVREFLYRRGLHESLAALDGERARAGQPPPETVTTAALARRLRVTSLYRGGAALGERPSVLEVLARHLLERRSGDEAAAASAPALEAPTLLPQPQPPPPLAPPHPLPPPPVPPPPPPPPPAVAEPASGGSFWARLQRARDAGVAVGVAAAAGAGGVVLSGVGASADACTIAHAGAGVVVVRAPGELGGRSVRLADCSGATLALCDWCEGVQADRLVSCRVLIGASGGSVFLRGCVGCAFTVARRPHRVGAGVSPE